MASPASISAIVAASTSVWKARVEAVDHVAETDGQADIDDLLRREVLCQVTVNRVVDRLQPSRILSVAYDRGLRCIVYPVRERVVVDMPHLVFRQPKAPTEHCVGG